MASVTSSCSVESDWSDEEIEELEKMFGHIQVSQTFPTTWTSNVSGTREGSKLDQTFDNPGCI
jgi:hypothetical protein